MQFVIIGGDAAGMSAAMEIVRNVENAKIVTLERGGIYSYGQCGLPYVIDGRIEKPEKLIVRDVETFREKYKIDARVWHEVRKVDVEGKFVSGVDVQSGNNFEIPYDRLLIATGADSIIPKWENVDLASIYVMKTIPKMKALLENLENGVKQVTVIGGGGVGLEVTETLRERGYTVRILEQDDQIGRGLDEDLASLVYEEALRNGVEVVLSASVQGFQGAERVQRVVTSGGEFETDVVIVAAGVRPNTEFLKGTGIQMFAKGAITVNGQMETSLQDVYAAGDCATHFNMVKQSNTYVPLGTTANKQGRIAGLNMAGKYAMFRGIVGTNITKFFNSTIAIAGLTEREAKGLGIQYDAYSIDANDIAGYYPGAQKMRLKIVVKTSTQELLGIQIVGPNGVDKRVDVFVVALMNRMTLGDLLDLDLAYAPPFNSAWDPIQQLARRYAK